MQQTTATPTTTPRDASAAPGADDARHFRASDLLGVARLGFDAAVGVVDIVEAVHHTIASFTGIVGNPPAGRTRGITGAVYGAVRGGTRLIGQGTTALLDALLPTATAPAATPAREQALAIVNGVWGDHLADSANPLAITAAIRVGGRAIDLDAPIAPQLPAAPTPRLLVLVHGLCMNDLQWRRNGHDHGEALARGAGWTPVYLHYNSGRHVADNGRELARLLQRLADHWPLALAEIAIVGHSMGGLVARSACHVADEEALAWRRSLTRLVFLGTPHHGAPLERGGRLVDAALGISPYAAPFARIGKVRSAGITDLRYGNVQDADRGGRSRHDQRRDDRVPTPLPAGVAAYAVAATTGERAQGMRGALVGDGLVPLASALGDHRRPAMALGIAPERRLVVMRANHWDLLDRAEVVQQLLRWLA